VGGIEVSLLLYYYQNIKLSKNNTFVFLQLTEFRYE